jgi:hypothetical protein
MMYNAPETPDLHGGILYKKKMASVFEPFQGNVAYYILTWKCT